MRKAKVGSGSGRNNGLLPNSFRIISSCLKTVSTNASSVASTVRSAGASVAASIAVSSEDQKDQVLWADFDNLELGQSIVKRVLLLGFSNGFQVLDVEDASNVNELVSKRDGPVTFLQMQPIPAKSKGQEGFIASHPLLLVVAGDETASSGPVQAFGGHVRDGNIEPQPGNSVSPTAVRFYSLRSHSYVHVLRFRSAIYTVRCSPRIVAVGLGSQIYCFDALTLENKFSVLTYPVPQLGGQGVVGVNMGYGPMAVGPRWLAYASNNPLLSNTGRLSPQNLTPSPGVSPSTSPGNGTLVARYAMESSKQLAAGIINLGDMGYKTLSKYYQELYRDGSSPPLSKNSNWKVGRLGSATHSSETDNAGMVVIKDFESRAVISQFKAHSSPISALCFDPSGMLLVTASDHGNNINIFRIMPSCVPTGSGTPTYDWSSSHVHLYKLYRGITTAVIQDICFSHYSQWIAIVSSRGTCHIFVLSPFGGDAGLQTQGAHNDGPILSPGLSLPWWSTSSCSINQQAFPPPPSITLSVVSRLKDGSSGWLNTVSNAAASATGKLFVPSGAIAAVFHNSVSHSSQDSSSKTLEHLLVYTPSGHLVQHGLLPSLGTESNDSGARAGSGSFVQVQDEELKVKVEPVQWWEVCRRSDWPEREVCVSLVTRDGKEAAETVMDNSDEEYVDMNHVIDSNSSTGVKGLIKPSERPHWYLSNAEVHIYTGRIPIWQKSKISFHMMIPLKSNERKLTNDNVGGEIEIEKIPAHEVEMRRKDLLPVFDHFHSVHSDWSDRGLFVGGSPNVLFPDPHRTKGKLMEDSVSRNSKSRSLGSVGSLSKGSPRKAEGLLDLYQANILKYHAPVDQPVNETDGEMRESKTQISTLVSQQDHESILPKYSNIVANDASPSRGKLGIGRTISEGVPSTNVGGISEIINTRGVGEITNASSASSPNILAEGPANADLQDPLDFGQYFQEGYCRATEPNGSHELTDINDADSSSSHCERKDLGRMKRMMTCSGVYLPSVKKVDPWGRCTVCVREI
ncbi:LOW QUALITY PROTEIN: autophagy-related protein 18g-like [Macadamia integrifolia]|uniref:LOW QUALITY PROTEIN: autophagy-related protein 18g-like n=1 Tax=Macadamia integrifolia TaxID=60698 RepID=UPI001C4EE5A9|nr:LOW QUALITY PROTEIN: autophagy-related protein 18g-like [Macadamia integrifolia]